MAKKQRRTRTPNVPTGAKPDAGTRQGRSARRTTRRQQRQRRNLIWIGGAIASIALVVILILVNNTTQAVAGEPPVLDLPADLLNGSVKGAADAPVVVTEFSDFECPACKSFSETAAKQLSDEYVTTGKIRFEYKHYPLPQHEPGATWAANAAECASDQGKFWEMHDYLFQEQGKQGPNTFTQGRLRSMGAALGLDTAQFDRCLSREEFRQTIREDVAEAQRLVVTATPTLFVNGVKIDSPSYTAVKAAIDAELQRLGQG